MSPGPVPRPRARWVAAAAALLIVGCSEPDVPMPREPAAFIETEYYGFGDAIGSRDTRAWARVWDLLMPRFGKLRHGTRELPITISPAAIEAELGARLVADGWAPLADLDRHDPRGRSYAFGWVKHGKVYVIVGLDHDPAVIARSPVNILTNIPGDRNYVAQSEGRGQP